MSARIRMIRRNVASWPLFLVWITIGAAGCRDSPIASAAPAFPAPAPLEWELTPLQQQFLMRPVSPEAMAGRPATRADLEEARSWFAPGELEVILAIVNRNARASGGDTLRRCFPVCDLGSSAAGLASK